MTKEDDGDFEKSTKCSICDATVDSDIKWQINVNSLKNIEALHTDIVISRFNLIIKFLLYFKI